MCIAYGTDTDDMDTATLLEEGSAEEIEQGLSPIAQGFEETSGGYGAIAAYAFMIFNLLCAPCFAAMGAIKREMNSGKWTWFAIGYQCVFAYAVAMIVYQVGRLFAGGGFAWPRLSPWRCWPACAGCCCARTNITRNT